MAERTQTHDATPSAFDTRRSRTATPWPTLAVVSAGGVLGALCRYGLGAAFPYGPTGFPQATFAINVLDAVEVIHYVGSLRQDNR